MTLITNIDIPSNRVEITNVSSFIVEHTAASMIFRVKKHDGTDWTYCEPCYTRVEVLEGN